MKDARIVEGPVKIGNIFGYFGSHIPAGMYAVVVDGEYANGGAGPSTVDGFRYRSRAGAERGLAKHLSP